LSLIRIANPDALRPGHVVMILLIVLTLGGSCLLYSGAPSTTLPDGAREWPANSLFRPLVAMLNLNYQCPAPAGADIKSLVFGLGVAFAVLAVGVIHGSRPRGVEEVNEQDIVITDPDAARHADEASTKSHMRPLFAAQVLMLLYVAWSFASIGWSDAGEIALYGSVQLALYTLWSFALAYGLSRASARFGAYGLAAVGAATAVIAIGYHIERNPTLRASFPLGNPTFLATCLIPGMLVAVCVAVAQVRDFGNPRRLRRVGITLLCVGMLVLMWNAFRRADSRGAQVGLAIGVGALFFFGLGKRVKLAVLALALICSVLAVPRMISQATDYSPTGRDASLRVRFFAWDYAFELIGQHKLLGHGQGGYTRKADALATGEDVADDPEALNGRIAHAHNEWLEVWADLGSVGLVLVTGALLFTLAAAATAVRFLPDITLRLGAIALSASLTGLVVAEASGVGLRGTGLPPVYYTVIGLIWAFCMPHQPGPVRALRRNDLVRFAGVVVAAVLAFGTAYVSIRDFRAARARYDVTEAMNNHEWGRALDLADQASEGRLSPQRRLVAQSWQVDSYLYVASVHLASGRHRAQTAMQREPNDQHLLKLASDDIHTAESCWALGGEVLMGLVRQAPDFYNSNWQEYRFQQIRAEIARTRGDSQTARTCERSSAVALKREIARRPYDTNMARLYVIAAGSAIPLDEICATLAKPLRYNAVPVTYRDGMTWLLTVPTFEERFRPIYALARSASPTSDPGTWDDPFAPETLRLAAVIWSQGGAGTLAEETLEHASSLYAALTPRFAYGAAACLAELAERRFLNAPLNPSHAIDAAQEAIQRAPASNEGRQLAQAVRGILVRMQLADGDEAAARTTLRELAPTTLESVLETTLSLGYSELVSALVRNNVEVPSTALLGWANRAVELHEENGFAWRQKAQFAFQNQEDAECVRCLRKARSYGAADEIIFEFVDFALQQRPTSIPMRDYSAELGAELRSSPLDSGQ